MSNLHNELAKYKKKGFEVRQKRTLKHGTRMYLTKERGGVSGWLGAFDGLYIYLVEGDSNTKNIREFLKDYGKFYEKEGFDEADKGLFVCSGKLDKGLFKDLRNVLLKDREIVGTIKTKALATATVKRGRKIVEEERIRERVTEREITRRRVTEEHISLKKATNAIKDVSFIRSKKERGYENQLYQALSSKGFSVVHERLRRGARFDLVLGENEIAVELKIIKSTSDFDRLIGQIIRYKEDFEKIVILLIDEMRNPSIMKTETKRIKKIDPKNIQIIIK